MKSQSYLALWTLVFSIHMNNACLPVRLAGDGRSTPSRDTTPPTITCILNIHKIADKTTQNASVWWNENLMVAADDRDDAVIKTRTGQTPGQVFSEGTTTITYHARDYSGNFAFCAFNITIEVIRCSHWDNLIDGWKRCNVGYDMRYGTVCEFGCYTGHVLEGPKLRECTMSGEWDVSAKPNCQKTQCPDLNQMGDQSDVVNISCTNENYFGSKCLYTCVDGHSLLPGQNPIRLCSDNETWFGDTPICFDTSAPVYTFCPAVVTGYAEPNKTSGQVFWETPSATDNSGLAVPVVQTVGAQSGSELLVGQYDVAYSSSDIHNNSAMCIFSIFVKQIQCPELRDLPYTKSVCPDGRALGSSCYFSCIDGTQLRGQVSSICLQKNTAVPSGDWDFQQQPYCEPIDGCPTLNEPKNGHLQCDVWELGTVCHMTCDEGYLVGSDSSTDYDEDAIYNTVLVCGNSGYWTSNGNIPDCQEEDVRTALYLRIGLQYVHVDDCTELENETMHSTLVNTFKDALQPVVCKPPNCNITNIQAICEDGRRKRSHGTTFELSIHLFSNMTSEDTAFLRSAIINITQSSQIFDNLKIGISGEEISPEIITVSQPDVHCEMGSGYDTKTSKCVKCNAGYYFDNDTSLCNACPQGYYQDMPRQNECIQCPLGTTTGARAASSLTECTEACAAGFYSETGTIPCSVCEIGSYSEAYSSTHCETCPRSQTTISSGASSLAQCQDFDLVFTLPNANLTSASVIVELQNISTFTVSLWVKCSNCDTILTLTEEERVLMSITNRNTLTLELPGGYFFSEEVIADEAVWSKMTVSHSEEYINIYISDHIVLHMPMNSSVTENVSSAVSLSVGGEGFQGSVSQVHMWSYVKTPQWTDICIPDDDGDLTHWGKFAQPEGLFVIAYTACDANRSCSSSPCQSSGSCTDVVDGFICTCLPGYTGTHCETDINNCEGNACSNNGTCIETIDDYTCVCNDDFTGNLCQLNVVNGGWTDWDISGACSVSCGTGVQQRSRLCENPLPSNGGTQCQGSSEDFIQCEINSVCVNECALKPTSVDYGDMNCEWTDNETRSCTPTCHDGYAFDNNIYLGETAPVCGKYTGYTWNIRNTNNPYAQIPSCTAIYIALKNTMYYSAIYDSLSSVDSTVLAVIKDVVDAKFQQTSCIQRGRCVLQQTSVYLTDDSSRRKRSAVLYVKFTSTITCEPMQSVNECYDLLVNILNYMEQSIEQQELTVLYYGVNYDVGYNTSSIDGTSQCAEGYVPVMHYCVPCGTGTYRVNNYCEICAQGYYQDELGHTSCKQCPDGFSTEGQMTRDRELCNVPVPASDDEIDWQVFTVSILCTVIGILLIVAMVYIVWDRKFRKPKRMIDAFSDRPPSPETPPIVRFNMRNVRYTGKAVMKVQNNSDDDDGFYGVQKESDVVFDVVQEEDYSIDLPETPVSYGVKSPPFRYSSPISPKIHAWK